MIISLTIPHSLLSNNHLELLSNFGGHLFVGKLVEERENILENLRFLLHKHLQLNALIIDNVSRVAIVFLRFVVLIQLPKVADYILLSIWLNIGQVTEGVAVWICILAFS